MLKRASGMGLPFEYVLADSWFFSEKLLRCVRKLKQGRVHLISMVKMGKAKYKYGDKRYFPKQLNRKRCPKLKATYSSCKTEYKGTPIKVFFKEAKQYLDLGGAQSQDLDALIGDATIAMIQYAMLSLSKRFDEYQTLGGMFGDHQKEALLWTLAERLWGLLQEILLKICEALDNSSEKLLEKLMSDYCPKLEKVVALWGQEGDL